MASRKIKSQYLAAEVGITERTISLLKSGTVKSILFETLATICEVLVCQLGDLREATPTD